MKYGSLFSGIGGMDLGLDRAGMTCAFQVEIDPFCRRVLEKHWPTVPKYGDIREVTGEQLGYCDLLAGGFPCQDVSRAGNRKIRTGTKGERSGLWGEFFRLVCEIRPRLALVENSPDLLIRGRGAERVFGDLASIGFDAEWSVISACSVGSPQARKRLFILAYHCGERMERIVPQEIPRFPAFSWREGLRSPAELRERPDVHAPLLCRTTDGISDWMDRLKSLGNAVVPQVSEWIGRRIMEAVA